MGIFLNKIKYNIDPSLTAEKRIILEDEVRIAEATLKKDGDGYYLTNFKNNLASYTYMAIMNHDLVLGLENGEDVRLYYSRQGTVTFNYTPPDFTKKQKIPGMKYPTEHIRRLERICK